MLNILEMGKEEILGLRLSDYIRPMTSEEFFHIAGILGAFWQYDYEVAKEGRVGKHAELKSGYHSDGFFVSKIFLQTENLREIISYQLVRKILSTVRTNKPDYAVGVPESATVLGKEVVRMLGVKEAVMEKRDGKILLLTDIGSKGILIVEDVCTKGTGFLEAVLNVRSKCPGARIMQLDPVILNRGGLSLLEGVLGTYQIVAVAERIIRDWKPTECPLCANGSKSIKPKAEPQNWDLLVNSQR